MNKVKQKDFTFQEHKKELLKDPKVKKAYEQTCPKCGMPKNMQEPDHNIDTDQHYHRDKL